MPPGIDTLTAAPMTIDIGGRPLRIAPLTLADLGMLQAWVNAQLPDPVAIARRLAEGFPPEVQSEVLREAYRDARESKRSAALGTLEADAILGTTDGLAEVLALGLRKHQPEMARGDVAKLLDVLAPGDLDRIMSHAFGDEMGAVAVGPKAPPAAPPAGGASAGMASTDASGSFPTDSTPNRSAG